ncbi:hypothetical protein KKF84_19815, partial [Myxococcota bacterium]|nr:hypothetical protein [Myxococcota bacterium]
LVITGGSRSSGGGLNADGAIIEMRNTLFMSNGSSQRGGAIYINGGSVHATNCFFFSNDSQKGGAVDAEYGSFTATNCVFYQNSANWGGAISAGTDGNAGRFYHCTFYNNTATYGRAMWAGGADIYNSIVWGTSADQLLLFYYSPSTRRGNISMDDTAGDDVIKINPGLKNPSEYDFTPLTGSPCIDAAIASYAETYDAYGSLRVDDPATTDKNSSVADIGAVEYQP